MTKCFQSDAPAKTSRFSEREAADLGPALNKVLGATDHEIVRGEVGLGEVGLVEVVHLRIPAGRP